MTEGFAYRLLIVNELLDFKNCIDLSGQTIEYVYQAVQKFMEGDSMAGSEFIAKAIGTAFVDLEYCKTASNEGEFRAFVQWLDRLTSFDKITTATTENMHLHWQEIEYRTAISKGYLFGPTVPTGITYEFGYSLGDVAYFALGPITTVPSEDGTVNAFTQ